MTEVNRSTQLTFDEVHDTQFIYRQLLDAMARPGKVNDIGSAVAHMTGNNRISQSFAGLAITLLDQEVTFSTVMANNDSAIAFIQSRTFCPHVSFNVADYVFVDRFVSDEQVTEIMSQVKQGTLIDPHLSATVLLAVEDLKEVRDVTSGDQKGTMYTLKGPGIEHEKHVFIEGMSAHWWKMRQETNQEYPLGVDMIIVSDNDEILAIPRTTMVEIKGVE